MKVLLFVVLIATAFSSPIKDGKQVAEVCSPSVCLIENNCRCSSINSPLPDAEIPQLIVLTFEEALTNDMYNNYWQPLLTNRFNPDGNPIGGTFYVPHEYTDYERVNNIYNDGFEIGVNSITKNGLQDYWRNANLSVLTQEFGGQRTILSKFANIPIEDIKGARTPQLQLNGDVSIEAYMASEILYDNSWPTYSNQMFFPYTLDYFSAQACTVASACPTQPHPGFWIQPITNFQGNGVECNILMNCGIKGSAAEITEWLMGEIERIRSGSRVPITLLINSPWFTFTENSYEGLVGALDALAALPDVFLVSQHQVIEWIKNPVPASSFTTDVYDRNQPCTPLNCQLYNPNQEIRYMKSCVACPAVYPWLGNPLGVSNPTQPPTDPTQSTVTDDGSTTTPGITDPPTTEPPTTTTFTPTIPTSVAPTTAQAP